MLRQRREGKWRYPSKREHLGIIGLIEAIDRESYRFIKVIDSLKLSSRKSYRSLKVNDRLKEAIS
ncbi:hypothetical protein BS333_18635 [Vibrio azureus]|uniref:Uncharacterized protein n=1 Tax=Vibrio azureus NBRC 104587 TaxID=1219077 RepID=U3ACS3_9VIBR|nr:hypothetical protein BS333_18635 [Vibrio azureus]GAD77726.1 hypothetical protein VAZ01S_087_00170 [Vibrio azureus NBRC 104587]